MNSDVQEMGYEYLFKILLIGNTGVGKSSLMLRFSDQTFSETFLSTIGVDFKVRTFNIQGKLGSMQIWDSAGQERFRTITTNYYKGAHGIILVYDITDLQSFLGIENWLQDIKKHASEYVVTLLVGNKADMEKEREVPYTQGQEFADSLGIKFIEASAKDDTDVEKAFLTLVGDIIQKKNNCNQIGFDEFGYTNLKSKTTEKGGQCC